MSDIKIIFDQSDLHIQENLNPKDLKIIFGYEESSQPPKPPSGNYPPLNWEDKEGDNINIDCGCLVLWKDQEGDNVNIDVDCNSTGGGGETGGCDNSWKDTNDFNCECTEKWDDSSNDFIIDCDTSSGGGGQTSPDLGTIRSYEGQQVSYSIYGLEIFTAHDGQESYTAIDIRQTIVTSIYVYEGQTSNTDLSANRYATVNYTIGETLTPSITYSSIPSYAIYVYEGQQVSSVVGTQTVLTYSSYDGSSSTVVLNTYPAIPFGTSSYDGSSAVVVLDIIKGFNVNAYDGSNIWADVFTPETGRMDFDVYEGQYTELDVGLTRSITSDSKFGNNTDLSISMNYDWSVDVYEGQYNNITFYNPQIAKLDVVVRDGHYLRVPQLNLDIGFIVNVYDGSELKSEMEYDPYQGLPSPMYSGEVMTFQLNSIHEIYNIPSYDGQYVTSSFNTYESFRMSFNAYDGQYVNTKPMFTIILGNLNAYDGHKLSISSLGETPNTLMYSGEEFEFELSTATKFDLEEYADGQSVKFDLKRGEPVTLGTFNAYDGINTSLDVVLLVSTLFKIHFRWGNEIFFNEWSNSPYHLDLGRRNCCVNFDNDILNIELNEAPYNSTSYDQFGSPCERMTFELSTRRTLAFNVHEGQYTEFDPTVNTLEVRVHEGQYVYSRDVVTEMTIDLEYGNLISEYNDVTIELNRPILPSDRKYQRMYSGESVFFKFGVPYAISPPSVTFGERADVSVLFDPYIPPPEMMPRMYMGERADTKLSTNVQIPVRSYEGQQTKITVYEDPHIYHGGEECHLEFTTKSDYYAEFVEKGGCLDNQYQETDENGQSLPNTFEGTNVEGERFLNFVEGRCF